MLLPIHMAARELTIVLGAASMPSTASRFRRRRPFSTIGAMSFVLATVLLLAANAPGRVELADRADPEERFTGSRIIVGSLPDATRR